MPGGFPGDVEVWGFFRGQGVEQALLEFLVARQRVAEALMGNQAFAFGIEQAHVDELRAEIDPKL